MRKMIIVLSSITVMTLMLFVSSIRVDAESYEEYCERWLQKQLERDEKLMDELEAEGTLTQEAIDSISKGTSNRKPNCKSNNSSNRLNKNSDSGSPSTSGNTTSEKGWVYSADELHVIGLPEGENGYTKPGYYGDVDGTYSSGYSEAGKGWVYSTDELHVIGLPEGEYGYTLPGWYGDTK